MTYGTKVSVLKETVKAHLPQMAIIGVMVGIGIGIGLLATGDIGEAIAGRRR